MKALWTPPLTVSVNSARIRGFDGSSVSRNTIPFLRFEAPSRGITPTPPHGPPPPDPPPAFSRLDRDRRRPHPIAARDQDGVGARPLGDESAVGVDARAEARNRIAQARGFDGLARRAGTHRLEADG